MKKHNLLKTIGIFFLVFVALTWIIPTGTFSGSEFTKGTTAPVGLFDVFRLPFLTIGTFIQYSLVFLAIGGLYGVLGKTGVFSAFVDKVAKKWKGKECKFLIIVMIVFALLASLTGLTLPLFDLVPLFMAVILVMGMSKLTALASTVGAILIGMLGSTYGFSINGYVSYFFHQDMNAQIFTKIILFVMLLFLLVMFVIKGAKSELSTKNKKVEKIEETKKKDSKKSTKKDSKEEAIKEEVIKAESVEIPFYSSKNKSEKSALPMVIIAIATIFAFVAMYNWTVSFNVTTFQDIHTSLMDVKIGGYPIVSNILGTVSQFGAWTNYEFIIILVLASLLIGWIYSVKFNDVIDGFLEGAKKMVGVAFYATICSLLFLAILNSNSGTIYDTISNFLLGLTKSFNIITTAITALIGGFFYNDFSYLLNSLYGVLTSNYDAATLPVIGLAFQTMYGFAMLLLPTSMILIAGLKYLDVSYKDWIKYIWKFLVGIFVLILVVLVIAALFI